MRRSILAWLKGVLQKMQHVDDVRRILNTDVAVGGEMREAIDLWTDMFLDRAPWLDDNTQSLGLPAAIAGEFARLVTTEFQSGITGSARGDWLDREYRAGVLPRLRNDVELACAAGGVVFKPYPDGDHIGVETVPAWRFLPTEISSRGEVTGAVFVERMRKGKTWYTRLEQHTLTRSGYSIRNSAYCSGSERSFGTPCRLAEVEEWAALTPELTIRYRGGGAPERPLFAYFRLPQANNISLLSPLGASVYSRAAGLIREADIQYSRILWEYEGSELAVEASYGALNVPAGDAAARLPRRKKRLFRQLMLSGNGAGGDLYQVFSPAIRDESLFRGLNELMRRIEFSCSLAYGTISDTQNVEKTATEIIASRQRSYAAVCDIQKALQGALEQLVWTMDLYASLYRLAPPGGYEVSFTWGDGVLQDGDRDFAMRKQLVDAGYLKPEKLLAWYFGITEEEARRAYMPTGSERPDRGE